VRSGVGQVLRSVVAAHLGEPLDIELADGHLGARVAEDPGQKGSRPTSQTASPVSSGGGAPGSPRAKEGGGRQGSLF
jgi:hypothetical protein